MYRRRTSKILYVIFREFIFHQSKSWSTVAPSFSFESQHYRSYPLPGTSRFEDYIAITFNDILCFMISSTAPIFSTITSPPLQRRKLNMNFLLFIALIICLHSVHHVYSLRTCQLNSGSVTLSAKQVRIETGDICSFECGLGNFNWKDMAEAQSEELTRKLAASNSSCPQPLVSPFGDSPAAGLKAVSRLPNLKSNFHQSFGEYLEGTLQQICFDACSDDTEMANIPETTFTWGDSPLVMICHRGYKTATNLCKNRKGITIFETTEKFVKNICQAVLK